jgi:hypothetical protein
MSNKGDGRVRVDALDRTGVAFNFVPTTTASVGGLLAVFPDPLPRLDIIEAAGKAIPIDSGPTQVLLPAGSPASQVVKVRAKDFGQLVPIRVVLTPDSGPAQSFWRVMVKVRAKRSAEARQCSLLCIARTPSRRRSRRVPSPSALGVDAAAQPELERRLAYCLVLQREVGCEAISLEPSR